MLRSALPVLLAIAIIIGLTAASNQPIVKVAHNHMNGLSPEVVAYNSTIEQMESIKQTMTAKDAWGTQFKIVHVPEQKRIKIISAGANRVFEPFGEGLPIPDDLMMVSDDSSIPHQAYDGEIRE